jgi:transposase
VAKNFIRADRDQVLLMPPSLADWLPKDHLAWTVLESVSQIDLTDFYSCYRDDGWGRAAFEPSMMVALLLYAYAVGVRSSREIERGLVQDVAFRVIAANNRPDHSTICRFRQTHEQALNDLFVSVLGLCVRAGMVRPEIIAIDGSKIAANASGAKNITEEQLRDFARRVFDEAAAVDDAEDELYGDRRGDELPEHLQDPDKRIEWIRNQLAAQGLKLKNNKSVRVNTTDPDSRPMKTPTGFVQGYNAQFAVTQDQVIVAVDVTNQASDTPHFAPMVDLAIGNLDAAGLRQPVGVVVADAGYFSDANASLDRDVEMLIAPAASKNLDKAIAGRTPLESLDAQDERRWALCEWVRWWDARHRRAVIAGLDQGVITPSEASEMLMMTTSSVKWLKWRLRTSGELPPARLRGVPPPRPSERQRMLERFAAPGATETYRIRGWTVEPVIGQIKDVDGLRRFLRRGLAACTADLTLQATAHNFKKLWRRISSQAKALRPSPLFV